MVRFASKNLSQQILMMMNQGYYHNIIQHQHQCSRQQEKKKMEMRKRKKEKTIKFNSLVQRMRTDHSNHPP